MTTQPIDGQPRYADYSDYAVDADAREAIETLHTDLRALSAQGAEATRRLDLAHTAALAARRSAADNAGALRRLVARVEWLEDRLRAAGTVPVAELDRVDAAARDLARAVLDGLDAQESLLQPSERASLLATVEAFRGLERERDVAGRDVLAISTVLETTARTDPAHFDQTARFKDAERRYAQAAKAVSENAPTARTAQDRLTHDAERRVAVEPTLATGGRAEIELDNALRGRLAHEVERGALMPSWFSEVLGPAPAGGGSTAAWYDVASAALAYRLVYGIEDVAALLGPAPDPDAPLHRAEEYDRLVSELRELGAEGTRP